MIDAAPGDLAGHVTRFVRALRARGVGATPAASVEAVRALEAVDLRDRADVYLALRAVLVSRREDLPIFDELFEAWWARARPSRGARADRNAPRDRALPKPIVTPGSPPAATFLRGWAQAESEIDEDEPVPLATPSALDARGSKDFSTYDAEDLAGVERAAARIARRLRARPSRRWKLAPRGARIDLRRLLRRALPLGGDPLQLAFRDRKLRRTKLVVLCDVSGSMDLYSRFLLQFLFALQHAFVRVETFAFSTRLVRISESLARGSYREALDALARLPEGGWSGGTKIGESLRAFVAGWPKLLDRRTVVIVLSDGWDTGDPAVLASALRAIRRRAGRIVWLNPLLGSPSYQPLTRGMQAALPLVDVFAPAHDLASLEALAEHLDL